MTVIESFYRRVSPVSFSGGSGMQKESVGAISRYISDSYSAPILQGPYWRMTLFLVLLLAASS